jgi:hypothetical protein
MRLPCTYTQTGVAFAEDQHAVGGLGPPEFICQWPVYGIGEIRVGLDAQLILDAARRSIQLWPEDDPNAR